MQAVTIDTFLFNEMDRSIRLSADVYSQNQNCSKRFTELWLVMIVEPVMVVVVVVVLVIAFDR